MPKNYKEDKNARDNFEKAMVTLFRATKPVAKLKKKGKD
jgi:hypothetical protein